MPALAGLAAPWWRPDATASFTGMTLSTDRGIWCRGPARARRPDRRTGRRRSRATSSAPLTTLRVDGGLTRSRRLMQATADLTQIPIEVYPSAHATALGAAALRAAGRRPDLAVADAVPDWTPATTYEPALVSRPRRRLPTPLAGRRHSDAAARQETPMTDTSTETATDYDFVVIGAGIVGAAIARELAGYDTVASRCVEARDDVGDGTSKANTAILHTGFDAKPGTLESRLVARGYHLLPDYAEQTGIPVERTGALLVAWNEEELAALPGLQAKADDNGYAALRDRRRRRGLPAGARPRARARSAG